MWILRMRGGSLSNCFSWQTTGGAPNGTTQHVDAFGNGTGCQVFDYWEPDVRFTLPQLIVYHAARSRRC